MIKSPIIVKEPHLEAEEEESEYDFEDAFIAFEEGDYEGALVYLQLTIEDLREEAEDLDNVGKKKVTASIKQLEKLQEALKNAATSEEEDDAENLADSLAIIFATAEMTIAHNYLLFARMYYLNEPTQAQYYLTIAIEKMDNAASEMESLENGEVTAIITTSKELLKNPKTSSKETLRTLEQQIYKLGKWLNKQ